MAASPTWAHYKQLQRNLTSRRPSSTMTKHLIKSHMRFSNSVSSWRKVYTMVTKVSRISGLHSAITTKQQGMSKAAEKLFTSRVSSTIRVWAPRRTSRELSATMTSHKQKDMSFRWMLSVPFSITNWKTTIRLLSGSKRHQQRGAHDRWTTWVSAMNLVTACKRIWTRPSSCIKKLQKRDITRVCSTWPALTSTTARQHKTRQSSKRLQDGS